MLRAGLCGTDLHLEQWDEWAAATVQVPMTLGHEFFGEVVEVGADVDHVAVGDRVSGEGHLVCGTCRNCRAGRRHLCINTVGVGRQPRRRVRRLRRHPGDQRLGAAGRPRPRPRARSSTRSATRRTRRCSGRSSARTSSSPGAGPIGVMATAIVRHAGARRICVTDMSAERLALAKAAGADLVVDVSAGGTLRDAQERLGMVEGFDIALEMSGSPLAVEDAAREHEPRRPGGAARPAEGPLRHRLGPGHHAHDHAARHLRPGDVRDLVPHGLDARRPRPQLRAAVSSVVTGRYAAEDWQAAFAETRSGQGGKVVLDWS